MSRSFPVLWAVLAATIPVTAKPRPDGKLLARQLFGLTLREVTRQLARDLSLPLDKGLLVVGIDADGPADRIGLKLKDIIFQVESFYVGDLEALGLLLEDAEGGSTMKLGVARGNVAAWVRITAGQRPANQPAEKPPAKPATSRKTADSAGSRGRRPER